MFQSPNNFDLHDLRQHPIHIRSSISRTHRFRFSQIWHSNKVRLPFVIDKITSSISHVTSLKAFGLVFAIVFVVPSSNQDLKGGHHGHKRRALMAACWLVARGWPILQLISRICHEFSDNAIHFLKMSFIINVMDLAENCMSWKIMLLFRRECNQLADLPHY